MKPVREVKTIFAEGFDHRSLDELSGLLAHKDRRVRMEAQFAIVDQAFESLKKNSKPNRARREITRLAQAAKRHPTQLARLHGIWGLGQIAAKYPDELKAIAGLLGDKDAEVRAQTAKVLGDAGYARNNKTLISMLNDTDARVRFFAAQSLGKLTIQDAAAPLIEMLRDNADEDLYLRHAGVVALAHINNADILSEASVDPDASVRLAALLAMRRLNDENIAAFLDDPDPLLILEAARAINDVPIKAALPQLAALAGDIARVAALKPPAGVDIDLQTPLMLRVVNANFRVGTETTAEALAALAANNAALEKGRTEALQALSSWAEPHPRDRIVGVYRPLEKREASVAAQSMERRFDGILASATTPVKLSAIRAAGALKIQGATPRIMQAALDSSASPRIRAESLHALKELDASRLALAVEKTINSDSALLRKTAVSYLGVLSKGRALTALRGILASGSIGEKQSAFAVLATLGGPEAEAMIREWLDRLLAGKSNASLHLDILEAAEKRPEASVKKTLEAYRASLPQGDEVAPFHTALHGGDINAGRKVFLEKIEVACIRCHKLKGKGGDVGPIQDGIGSRHPREYLLESIVAPSVKIAEGFASVSVEMNNGDEFNGTVKSESATELVLNLTNGTAVKIKKTDIGFRQTSSLSGMPPGMGQILTKRELRDLIEFLASLK
jgi:quinoprotein glucose dehydrogenase